MISALFRAAVTASQGGGQQGASVAAAAAAVAQPAENQLTYPKPRNFAERLMFVLESGLATDCLFWAGNGEAVALHSKNLKKGTCIKDYFNVKDYSGFIRNCNRWYVFCWVC